MESSVLLLTIISIILMQAAGVAALTSNSDIIGMAVAGCVSFVLLSFVVSMLIATCNWGTWFRNWMRQQGKVRMPDSYFKKKKGEYTHRLISASQKVPIHHVNGNLPRPVVDRDTLVQGWRQANPDVPKRIYEEKDATVELGDEVDDEYRIETEVVDNETLDVGPFKHDHSKDIPIKGDVYSEPYIYSAVDSTKRAAINVSNSVKLSNDSRRPPAVSKTSGTSLGNSVKPPSDSRRPHVVSQNYGTSLGNNSKPSNNSRASAVVTGSTESGFYTTGVNTDKFDEGLFYM